MPIQSRLPPVFTCLRCTHLHEDECIFNERVLINYVRGDILRIKESIHAVVYDHILDPAAALCGESPYPRPDSNPDDSLLKGRPAILMSSRPKAQGGTATICICGTFWGKSRRDLLPDVLRYFCVTLHPHEAIPFEPHNFHLHTKPEWAPERAGKPNGWVIACQYTSTGDIVGRWPNKARTDEQSSSSFTIHDDHESRERFERICQTKWRDFTIHCCMNVDAYKILRDDYEEWRRDKSYKAVITTANTSIVSSERVAKHEEAESIPKDRKGKEKARKKPKTTSKANANPFTVLYNLSSMNSRSSSSSLPADTEVSDTSPNPIPATNSKRGKSRRSKKLMSFSEFMRSF